MSIIRIDTDQAEATVTTLHRVKTDVETQVTSLERAVQELLSAWQGQSKQQFEAAWQAWHSSFNTDLSAIEPLANGIATERQQLIDADSSSSY